jgi:hypothetical protein
MDVVPYFVEAIRIAAKFFKHSSEPHGNDGQTINSDVGDINSDNALETSVRGNVHQALLNRVHNAANSDSKIKEEEQKERLDMMNLAVKVWMDDVKRLAKFKQVRKVEAIDEEAAQPPVMQETKEKPSVPYACFLYLWELQQTHSRLAVKRAALFLSSGLLQKSKDCRFHLDREENLSSWISYIVNNSSSSKNNKSDTATHTLLQREASLLLSSLVEKGYAQLYPKIGVASTRLKQQCPTLENSSSAQNIHMADWRKIRDIALLYEARQRKRVEKLISQAHVYLEVLVPRVGQETTVSSNQHGDDEDESDIEWEDGDEDDELLQKERHLLAASHVQHHMNHLVAVDRTLAVIESAGGLQGGEIEIDMKTTTNEDDDFTKGSTADSRIIEARDKLGKTVNLLANRYLPRLSLWLDGLINADNLVLNKSALVLLPPEATGRRQALADHLSEKKQSISSILSSAAKLSVGERTPAGISEQTTSCFSSKFALGLCVDSKKRSSLVSSMKRHQPQQKRRRQSRSNRIQIKCRSG